MSLLDQTRRTLYSEVIKLCIGNPDGLGDPSLVVDPPSDLPQRTLVVGSLDGYLGHSNQAVVEGARRTVHFIEVRPLVRLGIAHNLDVRPTENAHRIHVYSVPNRDRPVLGPSVF